MPDLTLNESGPSVSLKPKTPVGPLVVALVVMIVAVTATVIVAVKVGAGAMAALPAVFMAVAALVRAVAGDGTR
jgi:hypothetical protein